jgi:hypothetical protein
VTKEAGAQQMTIDQIILAASLLIVAGILGWGVLTMARGGTYNVKNSNRIMRYRIIFQALALVVILVLMWLRRDGNA